MLGNWARKDFGEKKIRSARFRAEPKGVPKMAKSEKNTSDALFWQILGRFGQVMLFSLIRRHVN